MIILGIDPGTATTGYGVVEYSAGRFGSVHFGVVSTPAGAPTHLRLHQLYRGLCGLIDTHSPDHVAIEQLFFSTNARTAIAVGQARGVAMLAAVGSEVAEYTPLQVKQAVTGYGKATKQQVQRMVQTILKLGELPRPDDAADALAIAICHAHSSSSVLAGRA